MSENKKPRLCEILGVEVGEDFTIVGDSLKYFVDEEGILQVDAGDDWFESEGHAIYDIINHPEKIIHAPRLSEKELEICRAVGAKWVSKNGNGATLVDLWQTKPEWSGYTGGGIWVRGKLIAFVDDELFPSVRPGDCISVEEAEADMEGHEWISVKDRLPDESDYYIVRITNGNVTSAWYSEKKEWRIDGGLDIESDQITHWIPFPKFSKEEL